MTESVMDEGSTQGAIEAEVCSLREQLAQLQTRPLALQLQEEQERVQELEETLAEAQQLLQESRESAEELDSHGIDLLQRLEDIGRELPALLQKPPPTMRIGEDEEVTVGISPAMMTLGDGVIEAVQQMHSKQANQQKLLQKEQSDRRTLQEKVHQLKGNIRVLARVRPLMQEEVQGGERSVVVVPVEGGDTVVIGDESVEKKDREFTFDTVFGQDSKQQPVYDEVEGMVTSVVDGYNACIFAYGQTGAGKTYTMQGPENVLHESMDGDGAESQRGINMRAVSSLFAKLQTGVDSACGVGVKVTCSMVEIYNDKIVDLLHLDGESSSSTSSTSTPRKIKYATYPQGRNARHMGVPSLTVMRNAEGEIEAENVTMEAVKAPHDVMALLRRGQARRAVSATAMNSASSRSHLVLTLRVRVLGAEGLLRSSSRLCLVDLAGSERVQRSGVQGAQLKEAQAINKSLSALGDVMSALQTQAPHVPFRNSKLTHLLTDMLGGKAKVLMIVHVSPTHRSLSESLCSLQFAARVGKVALGEVKKGTATSAAAAAALAQLRKEAEEEQAERAHAEQARRLEVEELRAQLAEAEARVQDQEEEMNGMREEGIALSQEGRLAKEQSVEALEDALNRLEAMEESLASKDAELEAAREALSNAECARESLETEKAGLDGKLQGALAYGKMMEAKVQQMQQQQEQESERLANLEQEKDQAKMLLKTCPTLATPALGTPTRGIIGAADLDDMGTPGTPPRRQSHGYAESGTPAQDAEHEPEEEPEQEQGQEDPTAGESTLQSVAMDEGDGGDTPRGSSIRYSIENFLSSSDTQARRQSWLTTGDASNHNNAIDKDAAADVESTEESTCTAMEAGDATMDATAALPEEPVSEPCCDSTASSAATASSSAISKRWRRWSAKARDLGREAMGEGVERARVVLGDQATMKGLWRRLDYNGNGIVSLAEVDKLVVELAEVSEAKRRAGDEGAMPYDGFFQGMNNKPALIRAFMRATSREGGGDGDDFVQRHEFRALLRNLWFFNKVWRVFEEMDQNGDRRLDFDEFKVSLGRMDVFLSEAEAEEAFNAMDVGGMDGAGAGGGMVLFDEFCFFVMRKMGLAITEDEQTTTTSTALDSVCEEGTKLSTPTRILKKKLQSSPFSASSPLRTGGKKAKIGGVGSKRSRQDSPSKIRSGSKARRDNTNIPAKQSRLRLGGSLEQDSENRSPNPRSVSKTSKKQRTGIQTPAKTPAKTPRTRGAKPTPMSMKLRSRTPAAGTPAGKAKKSTFGTTSRF